MRSCDPVNHQVTYLKKPDEATAKRVVHKINLLIPVYGDFTLLWLDIILLTAHHQHLRTKILCTGTLFFLIGGLSLYVTPRSTRIGSKRRERQEPQSCLVVQLVAQTLLIITITITIRAFSRGFYPKRLTSVMGIATVYTFNIKCTYLKFIFITRPSLYTTDTIGSIAYIPIFWLQFNLTVSWQNR